MFRQIYKKVMWGLENNLPSYLAYHNAVHTQYVIRKAILIAGKEKVSGHDLLLLKIAALYHDTGFTIRRENHESLSCEIAGRELKGFGFEASDIEQICSMIMATKIPQEPEDKLGQILADADLEYLSTPQFDFFSQKLYEELKHFQPLLSPRQWHDIQVNFISNHGYHTDYCRKFREPVKQRNLEKIKEQAAFLL